MYVSIHDIEQINITDTQELTAQDKNFWVRQLVITDKNCTEFRFHLYAKENAE
mgnify:CR=1 FL=1